MGARAAVVMGPAPCPSTSSKTTARRIFHGRCGWVTCPVTWAGRGVCCPAPAWRKGLETAAVFFPERSTSRLVYLQSYYTSIRSSSRTAQDGPGRPPGIAQRTRLPHGGAPRGLAEGLLDVLRPQYSGSICRSVCSVCPPRPRAGAAESSEGGRKHRTWSVKLG